MDRSSPAAPPPSYVVQLQDCIEELLKFTLISSTQGQLNLSLSIDYCANLLREDPSNSLPTNDEHFIGIPSYPLYKRLASALYQSIYSGALCTNNELTQMLGDLSFKRKQDEWNKLIVEEGHALLNILKEVKFELRVQEPFFTQLRDGLKTIEGRIKSGDFILLNNCVMLQVQDVHQYASFRDMLEAESLAEVLPRVKSIEEEKSHYFDSIRNLMLKFREVSLGQLLVMWHQMDPYWN